MNFLNIVTIAFFICYWPALLMYVALTNVLRALWFKAQGEDKWWIALIPCGHLYFDRMLAGVPIIAIVLYILASLAAFIIAEFVWCVLWILVCIWVSWKVGAVCFNDTTGAKYALIPFIRYYYMWKEVNECRSSNKMKNTKKSTKTKTESSTTTKKVKKTPTQA